MPALLKRLYSEGVHELTRVAVSGEVFGLSAAVDTRNHIDASADVEFIFETSTDGRAWLPFGGMRGIGAVLDLGDTPLKLAANEALNFASVAGVTTMKVSAVGYKGV